MAALYPMLQDPVLKATIWGGRRLESLLGVPLPAGEKVGEAWMVADHPHGTSKVVGGPLAGRSLRRIVGDHGEELYGRGFPAAWGERFPLLVKLIDAAEDLSVQVHPDQRAIGALGIADSAKTECWVILQADPGSRLIVGVRPGTDAETFRRAAAAGRLESMLVEQTVRPGEVVFVPAGRLHAIGRGIVLAEFQQSSDTTYRVYDWGRVDAQGRGRELHLDQAMACVDFGGHSAGPTGRGVIDGEAGSGVESLAECEAFYVHRATLKDRAIHRRLDRGFECVMIVSGEAEVVSPMQREILRIQQGQTALVPAVCGSYELRPCPGSAGTALLSGVPRPQ